MIHDTKYTQEPDKKQNRKKHARKSQAFHLMGFLYSWRTGGQEWEGNGLIGQQFYFPLSKFVLNSC